MAVLSDDHARSRIRTQEEERGTRKPPWAVPPLFSLNSILSVIKSNVSSNSSNITSDGVLDFSWEWKWEPIDFKTSSIKCPKALNTLLGRRFSACTSTGICPPPCGSPTNGCTCKNPTFQSPISINTPNTDNANYYHGHEFVSENDDANHISPSFPTSDGKNPTTVESIPEAATAGPSTVQSPCVHSDQNRTEGANAENKIESCTLTENVPSLEDGELEEGQISDEWAEEEDLGDQCSKPSETNGQYVDYDYGVLSSFLPQNKQLQGEVQITDKTLGAKRKRKKAKNKQQKQNQKRAKTVGGSSLGFELQERKRGCHGSKGDSRSSNDFKGKLNTSELVGKKSTEKSVNQGGQTEVKSTVEKSGEITLSSFLEGEIGLWTTETVDDVLRDIKAEKVGNKKAKRGPLTAERKEKRKITKKKKRAMKNKQLGVKRLKLAPVTQSKPVVFCKFYMKGRCAQGKLCPFSHDTIPITKSEICKYHVNKCCLKGEECPFSHDLSGFPCKFYHTKGYCLDGDVCRFSHAPLTGKALQEIIKQGELEKQGLCQKESAQSSIQYITSNCLQKSDINGEYSVGEQIENETRVESSKTQQQASEGKGTSSSFSKLEQVFLNESSSSALEKDQQIQKETQSSLQVSNILSLEESKRFDYDKGTKNGNAAFLAARKAASMALAAAANHEASLISRGLIRVPTFFSSAQFTESRDMDANYFGSTGPSREDKEVKEQSHSELLLGVNHKIQPIGLLNSSKSAMKILEESLCSKGEFEKNNEYANDLFKSTNTQHKTNAEKG
eukprot:Gb_19975 [translate_table: standard]